MKNAVDLWLLFCVWTTLREWRPQWQLSEPDQEKLQCKQTARLAKTICLVRILELAQRLLVIWGHGPQGPKLWWQSIKQIISRTKLQFKSVFPRMTLVFDIQDKNLSLSFDHHAVPIKFWDFFCLLKNIFRSWERSKIELSYEKKINFWELQ